MDFSNILFRCSSLGHIMTDPKSGTGLSETAKGHLVDVYVSNKYQRHDDIQNKYIEKGNAVEEDSITLLSRLKKKFYQKNEEHLNNQWIKGTPDLFEGKSIFEADVITDAKSSWDIYTFHRVLSKGINKLYYWQLQGYMDLSGAKSANLSYCLVNTPSNLIDGEKRKLMWQMGIIDPTGNELYKEACREIEKNFIYDYETFIRHNPGYDLSFTKEEWNELGLDIPMEERLIEFTVERNEVDIMKLHSRVEQCRIWLNEFEQSRNIENLKDA